MNSMNADRVGFGARFAEPILVAAALNPINTTMISVAVVLTVADRQLRAIGDRQLRAVNETSDAPALCGRMSLVWRKAWQRMAAPWRVSGWPEPPRAGDDGSPMASR